jgi:hypothetical protein
MKVEFEQCTVRVMRSHDYCHFEITLGILPADSILSFEEADNLRKEAARLVDKAVEQYKIKKADLSRQEQSDYERRHLCDEAAEIEARPETERTPSEQALLKRYKDAVYEANRAYDYED